MSLDCIIKIEDKAYPLAEHLILLLAAKYQNGKDEEFHYWSYALLFNHIQDLALDRLTKA